jgi:hypothetical protein
MHACVSSPQNPFGFVYTLSPMGPKTWDLEWSKMVLTVTHVGYKEHCLEVWYG